MRGQHSRFKIILLIADCYQITKIVEKSSQHLCHFRRQSHALARHEGHGVRKARRQVMKKSPVTDIACPYLTWGMHMFLYLYLHVYDMKKTKGTKEGSESDPNMFLRRQIARVFHQRMLHGLSTLWIYDWGHRWLMCASNACKTFLTLSMSGPKVIQPNINLNQLLPINRINPKHVGCQLLQEEKETFSLHLVTSLGKWNQQQAFMV